MIIHIILILWFSLSCNSSKVQIMILHMILILRFSTFMQSFKFWSFILFLSYVSILSCNPWNSDLTYYPNPPVLLFHAILQILILNIILNSSTTFLKFLAVLQILILHIILILRFSTLLKSFKFWSYILF